MKRISYTICSVSFHLLTATTTAAAAFSIAGQKHGNHLRLAQAVSNTDESTCTPTPQQALDILRDLDGLPIPSEYFSRTMGIQNVESYSCPESEAFRGFMSNGCRVYLSPGGQTAFYKRIDFQNLKHSWEKFKAAPHKIQRDLKSYQVVASFLSSRACHDLTQTTGVHIPKCYHAQLRPNYSNPMKSKFTFVLEDLNPNDGWYQRWLLQDLQEIRAVLSVYAKIHAFFWTGSNFWDNKDAAAEFLNAVWKSGSYVQPEAQGMNQWKEVNKEWNSKRLRFIHDLSSYSYWDNLGERLETAAEECGHLAHPFADDTLSDEYDKYRTFTHGDPKQANIFFRNNLESNELQVGLIDFQWSGFGLAATDIAHFMTSAVHADQLVDGGEESLLLYYFDELQKHLVEYNAYETPQDALEKFNYGTFLEQYDTAVLDLCRLVIAYTWARFEGPVEANDHEGCARTMNLTSYNKSLPNVVWLMSKCDEILKSRGL